MDKRVPSSSGQSTILAVLFLLTVSLILMDSALSVRAHNSEVRLQNTEQLLLKQEVQSRFVVLESALARRMWEPPPDASCMRMQNFNVVNVPGPGETSWSVQGFFDPQTDVYQLTATGTNNNQTVQFVKYDSALDVSNYMLFSTSSQPLEMGVGSNVSSTGGTATMQPNALIAGARRIYTKGPVVFQSWIFPNVPSPSGNLPSSTNYSPNGSTLMAGYSPAQFGTIIQGDRLQFEGGLYYWGNATGFTTPNAGADPANLVTPLSVPNKPAQCMGTTCVAQSGGPGAALITSDYNLATDVATALANGTPPTHSYAQIVQQAYPAILFTNSTPSGSSPLFSGSAGDSGSYLNDPNNMTYFRYHTGGAANWWNQANFTCLSPASSYPDPSVNPTRAGKYCSYSEDFPNGFKAWKNDANLNGVLFTTNGPKVSAPTLSWDNMQALKDDAAACGYIVSAPINPYQDCFTWDTNFMNNYVSSGGSTSGCSTVSQINLDSIPFNNLNATTLNDPNNADKLTRRVLYIHGPAEIDQTAAQGLMTGTLTNSTARQDFSVWIVSDDEVTFKGYQNDFSYPQPPLTNPSGPYISEVDFNNDSTIGGGTPPISLTVVSPENVHLVSPQYQPMTAAHLSQYFPVVGGNLQPIVGNNTDYLRNENDSFLYGYRNYVIKNVSIISSANTNVSSPFVLGGQWSVYQSSAADHSFPTPTEMCMMTDNGVDPTSEISNWSGYNSGPPSMKVNFGVRPAVSALPPAGSNFYYHSGGNDYITNNFEAYVFDLQNQTLAGAPTYSTITYDGILIFTNFASGAGPSGARDLSTPIYQLWQADGSPPGTYPAWAATMDITPKSITWSNPPQGGLQGTGGVVHCGTNIKFASGSTYKPFFPRLDGNGDYVFQQNAPTATLTSTVGAFSYSPMPEFETQGQ